MAAFDAEEPVDIGWRHAKLAAPATLPWVLVEAPPGAVILPMVTALGNGERAAIALAASRKSDLSSWTTRSRGGTPDC